MVKILKKTTFKDFYKTNEIVAKTSPMRSHYYSQNPLEKWLWHQKKKVIKELLKYTKTKNIIDLGCGDGGLIEITSEKSKYTGVDISPTQVKYAREQIKKLNRKNAKVYEADLMMLAIKDNTYDMALACDVVEHVLNPEKLLLEIKRIVKPHGTIIISIPNEYLWQLIRVILLRFPLRSPDHIHAISPTDIYRVFPNVIKEIFLPIRFSPQLSLIQVYLISNRK